MESTLLITPFYQNIQYSVQSQTGKWQKISKDHVVNYVNSRFRSIKQNWQVSKIIYLFSRYLEKKMKSIFWRT